MRTGLFDELGFEIFADAFDRQIVDRLTDELARHDFGDAAKSRKGAAFGVRNLLNVAPFVREFVSSEAVRGLVEPIAGHKAKVVRAIFFDKTPEANWKVPLHQDMTIAVRERKDAPGFTAWTQKAEIFHVQPPASVLESIVSLRVHLDDTDGSNGALRVVVGSHRHGRLSASEIQSMKSECEIVTCTVKKGGAMLMRPLLLHASSASANAHHRRVLHFEFSSGELPAGLQWFGS